MRWSVCCLLIIPVLTGCLSDDQRDEGVDPCAATPYEVSPITTLNATDDVLARVNDTALAWDFPTTNVRTCTMRAIGHTPLRFNEAGAPDPHGYLGEIDMRGDLDMGAVAVLGNGETPTAYLLDIRDRTDPQVISSIEQPGVYMVDIKISDDGRYLFTASQSLPAVGDTMGLPALEPHSEVGFTIYDITDPAQPVHVDTYASGVGDIGCHMLSHEIIGGTHVVFCVGTQIEVWAFEEPQAGTLVPLGQVQYLPEEDGVPTPSEPLIFGLAEGTAEDATGEEVPDVGAFGSGPHDMTVTVDEATGAPTMVVSHWDSGVRVVDLSDAPQVTELGAWKGEGATHYDGNVHTAMMFYADGARYIIASPEYTYSGQVPSLWVLDATDYSDMHLVGEWYHPGEHESQALYLTTHQWQVAPTGADVPIEDVNIYLTMNHGGVWSLGLDEILQGDNLGAIQGFHLGRTPLDPDTVITQNARLSTWDVNVVDGYIYGSDRATGLWVFESDGTPLGDPAYTGFA